MFTTT